MKTMTFVKNGIKARPITRDEPKGLMTTVFLATYNIYINNVYRPQGSKDDSWIHQKIMETRDNNVVFTDDFNRIGLQTLESQAYTSQIQEREYTDPLDFLN